MLNHAIYYSIVFRNEIQNKTFKINKRYSEFYNLDKQLRKIFKELPDLPGRTFWPPKETKKLEKRRQGLSRYLKVKISVIYHRNILTFLFLKGLFRRTDVINTDEFKNFINLPLIAPVIL
jgi:hypothetical protein